MNKCYAVFLDGGKREYGFNGRCTKYVISEKFVQFYDSDDVVIACIPVERIHEILLRVR